MDKDRYNELVRAAELLKENCNVTESECPFSIGAKECYKRTSCALSEGLPHRWLVPNRAIEWTEGEKTAAKALKDAGVVSIKRGSAREMVVELFGLGMAPFGAVPYAMFPNLDYNKAVLLRDIIEEG